MAAAGQMPSQAPFLIIFQIILWRKAPQAAAHVQPERIRTQGPQLSHTVGEGFRRDRAGTVSLGPQQDWGLVWVDTGQAQPSWCHLVPEEQGAHGRAQPPLCHGKWRENKLPLHLFPGKGWTVVCTVKSGPLTSPTRVTGCAKSSYEALSGTAAVPGTEGQIPSLTLGRQKSGQSSRGGAQGLVPTQPTEPRKRRDVAAGILQTPHNGFVSVGEVEAAGICPWRHTELFVNNICVSPPWGPSSVLL